MSWIKRDIAGPIPAGLGSLASTAGTMAGALTPLLATASAAVAAAQSFFNPTTNPYAGIANSLLTQAQALSTDLFSTGVYYLSVNGDNVAGVTRHDQFGIPLLTPRQAITAAISSFDDLGDTQRPQFSNNATVCALGLLGTVPSPGQFTSLLNGLNAVLSIPDLNNLSLTIGRRSQPAQPQAVPPNWISFRLNSIPQLASSQTAINNSITTAEGYLLTANNALTQLHNVITAKQNQINQLQTQINQLATDLKAFTGLYTLNVPPSIGGNALIKAALVDCPLELSNNQYTFLILFVGGGPSLTAVDMLRQMVL